MDSGKRCFNAISAKIYGSKFWESNLSPVEPINRSEHESSTSNSEQAIKSQHLFYGQNAAEL